MTQELNTQLPRQLEENAETFVEINRTVEDALETLEQGAKATGLTNVIQSVEKFKACWEEGLKQSHNKTEQLYRDFAEEQRRVFAAYGVEC